MNRILTYSIGFVLGLSVLAPSTGTSYPSKDDCEKEIRSLISKLDATDFKEREYATQELEKEPWDILVRFLPKKGSPEMMARVRRLERKCSPVHAEWMKDRDWYIKNDGGGFFYLRSPERPKSEFPSEQEPIRLKLYKGREEKPKPVSNFDELPGPLDPLVP